MEPRFGLLLPFLNDGDLAHLILATVQTYRSTAVIHPEDVIPARSTLMPRTPCDVRRRTVFHARAIVEEDVLSGTGIANEEVHVHCIVGMGVIEEAVAGQLDLACSPGNERDRRQPVVRRGIITRENN